MLGQNTFVKLLHSNPMQAIIRPLCLAIVSDCEAMRSETCEPSYVFCPFLQGCYLLISPAFSPMKADPNSHPTHCPNCYLVRPKPWLPDGWR